MNQKRPTGITDSSAKEPNETPPPEPESEITPPLDQVDQQTESRRKPYDASGFKKKINENLTEAFSRLDPRETPWFGMDLDADLLAVAPYGITVATIVDPCGIEKASVHKSLIPEGPWLLTLADGRDFPIDNPVRRAKQAMRIVEDKLTAFFDDHRQTSDIKVRGLVVFPDGYDLTAVNDRVFVEESANPRAINACALQNEMRQPIHAERLNADLYRNWISKKVLHDPEDDSVALSWLDPNGDTISRRVRTLTARKPLDDPPPEDPPLENQWRLPPPETASIFSEFSEPMPAPFPRKAGRRTTKVAGLLVIGMGMIGLWEFYGSTDPLSQSFFDRVLEKKQPPRELAPYQDFATAQKPESEQAPRERGPTTLKPTPTPPGTNGNPLGSGNVAPGGPSDVSPPENKFPDANPPPSGASWQKEIENQIDRAIHQRAVEGVVVAFVNDTAYLTGAVLSGKQKAAAEEAARNVPGVKRVHSSISVKWETG